MTTRSSQKRKILEGVLAKISKREAAFLPSDTEYMPPLASTANSNSMTTTRLTRLFDELSHKPSISRQASISSSNSILTDHLPEDTLDMQKLHQKKREEIRPKRFIENNWVYTALEVVARKISHAFARKEELDETLAVVGLSSDDEDADSLVGVVNSDLESDDDGNFGLSQDVKEHRSTHKELEFVGSDDCWGLDADMVPTLFIP